MPRIVDATRQRARIRAAARRVFSRRGIAGVGLTHVAREAGVSRANLYHYYVDKAELVRDLAQELLAEEEALFREALESPGSVVERIEGLVDRIVERFATWSRVGGLLLQVWMAEQRHVRTLLRALRSVLAQLLREAQEAGEVDRALSAEAIATLLIGMIDGLILQVFLDPRALPSEREMRRSLLQLLGKILRPESPAD
ncbi:MAG: TetR/AcrR family transcriptional regulator [Myxococcota bacterium]